MPLKKPPTPRNSHDRRHHEEGPPTGWKERRKMVERRRPEVAEASMEDWEAAVVEKRAPLQLKN